VMQYWFNGTLIIDRHDIMFRTGAHPRARSGAGATWSRP